MKKYIIAILFLTFAFSAFANEFPKILKDEYGHTRLVQDHAKALNRSELNSLEQKLRVYNDSTSSEVSVVIIQSTGPYDISQYAADLGETWGIGKKGKNNGVLLLVALRDRKVNISTGYGMEAVVPDAAAHRIIEDYIKPNFRNNNYYKGLDEATTVIFGLASGEFKADALSSKNAASDVRMWLFVVILATIFVIIPAMKYKEVNKSHYGNKHKGVDFLTTMILLNSMGRRRGSSFGDFSRGGGSFRGGSGFGGFGGGSFGGGGASGSW